MGKTKRVKEILDKLNSCSDDEIQEIYDFLDFQIEKNISSQGWQSAQETKEED